MLFAYPVFKPGTTLDVLSYFGVTELFNIVAYFGDGNIEEPEMWKAKYEPVLLERRGEWDSDLKQKLKDLVASGENMVFTRENYMMPWGVLNQGKFYFVNYNPFIHGSPVKGNLEFLQIMCIYGPGCDVNLHPAPDYTRKAIEKNGTFFVYDDEGMPASMTIPWMHKNNEHRKGRQATMWWYPHRKGRQ